MIVVYDFQIMLGQKYGGISRYFHELILRFQQNKEISPKVLCVLNDNAYFANECNAKIYSKLRGRRFINKLLTKAYLAVSKYDVYHPTYYDPQFVRFNKGKLVITVYDMIHEKLSKCFSENDETAVNKSYLIKKADGIIAISQSTKNDILELFPEVDESKIRVIYLSTDMKKSLSPKRTDILPPKYILFVGRRGGYKNFARFCEAVSDLLKEDPELCVLCVGGGKFTEEEISFMGKEANRFCQVNLDDESLASAYTYAECFVFPSMYEGFGIPTLEAFACECPVVLSNTSSMTEVGGDAVVYFNPKDVDDMRSSIRNILYSDELKKDLINKGKKQLLKFQWDVISLQTMDFYKQVLGN